MTEKGVKGAYLASQHIREAILNGGIVVGDSNGKISDSLEKRIQPASLDAAIGDELFVIDTHEIGLFRPRSDKSVYRSLLELPKSRRREEDITNGYEVKKGFTYLIKLDSKISSMANSFRAVRSSPKSSMGRLFAHTRLLADGANTFDEFRIDLDNPKDVDMWVSLQPHAFNLIVYPGITLNQLRFLQGGDQKS